MYEEDSCQQYLQGKGRESVTFPGSQCVWGKGNQSIYDRFRGEKEVAFYLLPVNLSRVVIDLPQFLFGWWNKELWLRETSYASKAKVS